MGKYTWGMMESEMDETSRLILMVAKDEGKEIDLLEFATEFRNAHPNSNIITVMTHWKKWHGSPYEKPTHDFETGERLR